MTRRLPWEIIETLPGTDPALVEAAAAELRDASTPAERVRALVHRALVHYWAPAVGATSDSWASAEQQRRAWITEAVDSARLDGRPELVATALLGHLYGCWGPIDLEGRGELLAELDALRPSVDDQELRVRITEWGVLDAFDRGDLRAARAGIDTFLEEARGLDSKLFNRREMLWRANLAMLEGDIDTAVRLNEEAIATTADLAGSPFSFQNVAITTAIAMYFRRGLADVIDAIRSIRASSPRVASNWDVGLTFALSEVGAIAETEERFAELAHDRFAVIPRDLNWLVCIQLMGLVAATLDDRRQASVLLDLLRPFAAADATHGSGYASYGPVGRVVGLLSGCLGEREDARRHFDEVLATRPAGPWTTLTRLDRALLNQHHDPAAALDDAIRAETELRGFGLDRRADDARDLATAIRLTGEGDALARLDGARWALRHPAGTASIRNGVGARLLTTLLARPGEAIDVLELDERIDPTVLAGSASTEPVLDAEARAAYRRRLDELDNLPRLTRHQEAERTVLRTELAGGGHAASSAPEIERARVRVTRAIRRTIDAIAADSPALAAHLTTAVETGRRCSYAPSDGGAWRVER